MADKFPTSWVIDVCRYCGAKAEWPGLCEHWKTKRGVDPSWTAPVRVTGTLSPKSRRTD